MEISLSRIFENKREGCDWKASLTYGNPAPCSNPHDGIQPQSTAIFRSVPRGGSYNDRPLVLKGQNVLNAVFADRQPEWRG